MADKRRKRTLLTASSIEDASKEYHAVDMGDAVAQRRRRSDCNSNSSTGSTSRGESWMTKVTAAMSQRIFAGKKLGASRSTQVMPLATTQVSTGAGHDRGRHTPESASATLGDAGTLSGTGQRQQYSSQQQTLRQVSSENSLARTAVEPALVTHPLSTPVERVDFCPSIVCDIAAGDDSDDDNECKRPSNGHRQPERQSVLQTIRVQSAQRSNQASARSTVAKSTVIEKVVPRAQEHGDDDFDILADDDSNAFEQRRRRASRTERLHNTEQDRNDSSAYRTTRDRLDTDDDVRPSVSATAPILKDFFSRSATTGLGIRVQQRESRRDALYQTSRERQARLREHAAAEALEATVQLRKLRAEQLQRASQQRRARVRREAASAHKHLTSRLARDQMRFVQERERWESEFEDEMRLLSDAFRKASAKTQHTDAVDSSSTAGDRPMTVAGLAVPEALSQIRRDANNYERRLKTAAPRLPLERDWDVRSHRQRSATGAAVLRDDSADFFALGGDERDFEAIAFESDDVDTRQASDDSEDATTTQSFTLDELLDERESLLERIAALEALVARAPHE